MATCCLPIPFSSSLMYSYSHAHTHTHTYTQNRNLFISCGIYYALGGELCVKSTEEVYALCVEEEMEGGGAEKKDTFQRQLSMALSKKL